MMINLTEPYSSILFYFFIVAVSSLFLIGIKLRLKLGPNAKLARTLAILFISLFGAGAFITNSHIFYVLFGFNFIVLITYLSSRLALFILSGPPREIPRNNIEDVFE